MLSLFFVKYITVDHHIFIPKLFRYTSPIKGKSFRIDLAVLKQLKFKSLENILSKLFVKINFISLVNLILNKEVVKELIQSDFNKEMIKTELNLILKGKRNQIQKDYKDLRNLLKGDNVETKIVNHIINN